MISAAELRRLAGTWNADSMWLNTTMCSRGYWRGFTGDRSWEASLYRQVPVLVEYDQVIVEVEQALTGFFKLREGE